MTDQPTRNSELLTVGQVAERFDMTVRTLHHYDALGLLSPGGRSPAGYRLYTAADLTRLQHVVVYRRLGFPLEQIRTLLEAEKESGFARDTVLEHLRRQREAVMARLDELRELVVALDRATEKERSGVKLTKEEQQALFGKGFSEDHAEEAERRWGGTEAWKESRRRASTYGKEDWTRFKAELDAIHADYVAAMRAGEPSTGPKAMDVAERARQQVDQWFYPLPPAFHRKLADMYLADPRFTQTYEALALGLARYVHEAIHANADRQERGAPA